MFGSGILGSGLIRVKLRRVGIGSVLKRVGYGLGMGCPFLVHFGSGHYRSGMTWVGSFRVWINFGFRSVMDRFTSGVRVQIGSAHFGCRFGYGFGSIGSGSGFGSVLPGLDTCCIKSTRCSTSMCLYSCLSPSLS